MKLFLSADIEGTAGIVHWDETGLGKPLYEHFSRQMTREVAAACEGAQEAGAQSLLVKDAHGSARNIDPEMLPECVDIFRGWGRDPYCMMSGLTASFDGVLFTGYHSAAGTDANPLSHTMDLHIAEVRINGEIASELYINCLIAALENVPVYFVSGDQGLCDWVKTKNPNIRTVAVSRGVGRGSVSIHPDKAVQRIRESVAEALTKPREDFYFPMPNHFDVEIDYKEHADARRAGFFPGAKQTGPRRVAFASDDYRAVLAFFLFVL